MQATTSNRIVSGKAMLLFALLGFANVIALLSIAAAINALTATLAAR